MAVWTVSGTVPKFSPIMPRLFMAVRREDRFSILDILRQTPEIPDNCQWAMFLRNHDELTLEMVTDEERDFMYSVYAKNERARINLGIRRRLAPLLGNDRRQIELLNGLLFSMTGTPIIYYGDEIGMGDNIYLGDRNGVRTPFQWSSDRNAGFSKADPQQLFLPVIQNPEYHYTTVNVENQLANETSLLRWIQTLIELRKSNIGLTRGKMKFLEPANQAVLAFTREYDDPETGESQKILVVANLSKRAQYVEMDMADYKNLTPVELRGETAFPPIGELPYLVTLGPYDFYWFELQDLSAETKDLTVSAVRHLQHLPDQREIMSEPELRRQFEHLIKNYLPKARWFSSKDLVIKRVNIKDRIEVPQLNGRPNANLLFVEISFKEPRDRVDTYLLAVVSAEGLEAELILKENKDFVIASYDLENQVKGIYYDAIIDPIFMKSMMSLVCNSQEIVTDHGLLKADILWPLPEGDWCQNIPDPKFIGLEQSNSSLRFGHEIFFKMFRRLEEGINPEIEIGEHLNRTEFANAPRLLGSISYQAYGHSYSIATAHQFLEGSQGSAWDLFEKEIEDFAAAASSGNAKDAKEILAKRPGIYNLNDADLPAWFIKANDHSAGLIKKLGQRTAELHNALGHEDASYAFLPEDITPFYLRSFYQSLRNRMVSTHNLLEKNLSGLSESNLALARQVIAAWPKIEKFFDRVRTGNFGGKRTRVHGDYHLGQVMFAKNDFNILDYEGEPLRPISQRRLKNTPLQDTAGLLRSIDYAVHFYLKSKNEAIGSDLGGWLELWRLRMSREFMAGYRGSIKASLLPDRQEDIEYMTEVMLLHKALYEVSYELSSRPDWLPIPLNGILNILPGLGETDAR